MVGVVKAMHTANMRHILLESLLSDVSNVLERFGMMDTQAIDVVTFGFRAQTCNCFSIDLHYSF